MLYRVSLRPDLLAYLCPEKSTTAARDLDGGQDGVQVQEEDEDEERIELEGLADEGPDNRNPGNDRSWPGLVKTYVV